MKPQKKVAGVLAAALAMTGGAVLATGTANAATGPWAVACHLYFGGGLPGGPGGDPSLQLSNSVFVFDSLTVDDTTPNAGQVVNVTLTSTGGITNGPVTVGVGGLTPTAKIALSGAQTGEVTLTSATSYPAVSTNPNTSLGTLTLTGSYTATGNGTTNLAFKTLETYDNTNSGANNFCDGTAAGTAALPAVTNANFGTNGTGYQTTNFVDNGVPDDGISVSGFRVERIAAGPTVAWEVPTSWNPYSGPIQTGTNTPTAGYGGPTVAGAPVASASIVESTSVTGPNATIVSSTGQNAGVQAIRTNSSGAPVTTTTVLSGSVWDNNVAVGGFTVQTCNSTGTSCDVGAPITNALSTGATGVLSGTVITTPANTVTTGNRALKLTQGTNTALVPVLILGQSAITLSPAAGGPNTPVAVSGSFFNPSQSFSVYGSFQTAPNYLPTADAPVTGTATGTGTIAATFNVVDATTATIVAYQGIPGAPSPSNPAATAAFTFSSDRCVAYDGNFSSPGNPDTTAPIINGCDTKQDVKVTVTAGRLVQRAYVNTTAATGSTNGTLPNTPNVNSSSTQINLGTLTTPLAPATIVGNMNDITVTDNRGGTYGWSLTAQMNVPLTSGTDIIPNTALTVAPSCSPALAANSDAWDYDALGKTAIAGFDYTLVAPGQSAGAGGNFGSSQNLCTKNTDENANTDSTGGVYNVTGTLTLVVPAFQAAGTYSGQMTTTLV